MRSRKKIFSAALAAALVLLLNTTALFTSCGGSGCAKDTPMLYRGGSDELPTEASGEASVETSEETSEETSAASEGSESLPSSDDKSDEYSSGQISSEEKITSRADDAPSVTEPPRITTQPKSAYVKKNGSVKVSVKAKGDGLKYQWYVRTDKDTVYSAGKGLTHASETIKHDGEWKALFCYCVVTDKAGQKTASDAAVIDLENTVRLLAVGDSICRGGRNSRKGFVGDLGLPYRNAGLNGATLSTKETAVTNIPNQLAGISDYSPDIIIADGGVNDYIYNAPLGTVPTSRLSEVGQLSGDDLATAMGGLQKLFVLMRSKFPDAKRYFVITHKTTQRIPQSIDGAYVYTDEDKYVDWTVTKNKAGYSQQDLHDAIVACCKVYDVEVIDIYKNSALNTANSKYCSKTSYFEDPSVTDTEYVDIDGVHPLQKGYAAYYLPLIRKKIKSAPQQTTTALPLAILLQPTDRTVANGDSLTLSLKASGTNLRYQWYYKKKGQSGFNVWKNRTHSSETVTPNASWNGIQLYCVVTDGDNHTLTSDTFTVTVK